MPIQRRISNPQISFSKLYSKNTRFIRTHLSSFLVGTTEGAGRKGMEGGRRREIKERKEEKEGRNK